MQSIDVTPVLDHFLYITFPARYENEEDRYRKQLYYYKPTAPYCSEKELP